VKDFVKKEVAFERVIFFSDAIAAIAITLLALDLRLEIPPDHHITFSDLLTPWRNYLSFFFPILAFVFLFFKLPMFLFGTFYMTGKRKNRFLPQSKSDGDKPKES
jgi:uncharacterized membrane protein